MGDASATEMSARGEHNVGQLCRATFGEAAYIVGFGTDHGTVAAASDWDEPMQRMRVRPAHEASYERIFHDTGVARVRLAPARARARGRPRRAGWRRASSAAIGVVYRPETELASHYFQASLPQQFDEYHLVRRDARGAAAGAGPAAHIGAARHLPVRALTLARHAAVDDARERTSRAAALEERRKVLLPRIMN